jgi:hypothetical protein
MKSYGIRRVWQRRGLLGKLLWLLLLPISFAFLMVVTLRNALYTRKWLATRSLDRPVISIGNLSVGGTGKTPTTLWLARSLAQRGFKVGILSRGYMRKETRPIVMRYGESSPPDRLHSDDVASCGDEPAMMARLYGLTVSVTKDRYRGGLALLKQDPVDVFILDDGFQHRKLRRDFDLVLLGEDVPGWVLPCGPFRETKRALRRADGFLITGSFEDWHKLIDTYNNNLCFDGELQPQVLLGVGGEWLEGIPAYPIIPQQDFGGVRNCISGEFLPHDSRLGRRHRRDPGVPRSSRIYDRGLAADQPYCPKPGSDRDDGERHCEADALPFCAGEVVGLAGVHGGQRGTPTD